MKTRNIRILKKKVLVKAMFTLDIFEILLLEGRLALGPAQQRTAKGLVFNHYYFTQSYIKYVVLFEF